MGYSLDGRAQDGFSNTFFASSCLATGTLSLVNDPCVPVTWDVPRPLRRFRRGPGQRRQIYLFVSLGIRTSSESWRVADELGGFEPLCRVWGRHYSPFLHPWAVFTAQIILRQLLQPLCLRRERSAVCLSTGVHTRLSSFSLPSKTSVSALKPMSVAVDDSTVLRTPREEWKYLCLFRAA